MDICDKVEAALADTVPVFFGTPEFTDDDEPQRYIIYTLSESGGDYAESIDHTTEYMISLNIYTPKIDFPLYKLLKGRMRREGFVYIGGGKAGDEDMFPYTNHYYLDFSGVEDCG